MFFDIKGYVEISVFQISQVAFLSTSPNIVDISGSNTDCSFTTAVSNSFVSPLEKKS